jgi:hypothetical protein
MWTHFATQGQCQTDRCASRTGAQVPPKEKSVAAMPAQYSPVGAMAGP